MFTLDEDLLVISVFTIFISLHVVYLLPFTISVSFSICISEIVLQGVIPPEEDSQWLILLEPNRNLGPRRITFILVKFLIRVKCVITIKIQSCIKLSPTVQGLTFAVVSRCALWSILFSNTIIFLASHNMQLQWICVSVVAME